MHGGTTICLSVHAKYAATCCTICLMEIRLITLIHEVDKVRPSQLTTVYKMLNSFLWYTNQSVLFLSDQPERGVIVPRSKNHIKSKDKNSPIAVLHARFSMKLSCKGAQKQLVYTFNYVNLLLLANSPY